MSTAEAKIYARLKSRLSKYGYTLSPSGSMSYLAELGCMEWFLPSLECVEDFLDYVRGGSHDL